MTSPSYKCQAADPATCSYHSAAGVSRRIDLLFSKKKDRVFAGNHVDSTYSPHLGDNDYRVIAKEFQARLSDEDKRSILGYVHSGFKFINFALNRGDDVESFPEYDKRIVKRLDTLFEQHADVEKPNVLYRGLRYDTALAAVKGARVGKRLSVKNFQSTTASPIVARNFVDKSAPVILEIKGASNALPISFRDNPHSSEEEYLLNRNTEYRVVKVSKKVKWSFSDERNKSYSLDNVTVIELIEIPAKPSK